VIGRTEVRYAVRERQAPWSEAAASTSH